MGSEGADEDELAIRTACGAGDITLATTTALRRYGSELLGFLAGMLNDYDSASDAFAMFSERLWRAMPQFQWKCSLRTWCYRLARNAAIDVCRTERRKGELRLSSAPEVFELAERLRTNTLSLLRTEKRGALERLRDELSEEDRALLVLRVDRQLEWRELALVLASPPEGGSTLAADDELLKREAARLRKRFQLVKERLRTLGRERGLL